MEIIEDVFSIKKEMNALIVNKRNIAELLRNNKEIPQQESTNQNIHTIESKKIERQFQKIRKQPVLQSIPQITTLFSIKQM